MSSNNNQNVLLVDATNLLYRTFYAYKQEDDQTIGGLAHVKALYTVNKYYNMFKPRVVAMAFDRSNWRKEYTKSEKCVSGKIYKGHRRQDMTPNEAAKFQRFCEHINEFEEMMRKHSKVVCLSGEGLEADDLIAGAVDIFNDDHDIFIVSSDKDLMQLLKAPNIKLIDPQTDKERTLDEYHNDVDWFMFLKCIRGDRGDNVSSAYPRITEKKLREAYQGNAYLYNQIMKHEWTNADGKQMVVEELFKENQLLMDLTKQPQHIKNLIYDTIEHEFENPGQYSYFHFLKFCGKYEMKHVAEKAHEFAGLLS